MCMNMYGKKKGILLLINVFLRRVLLIVYPHVALKNLL